jgi:hypothetical protein
MGSLSIFSDPVMVHGPEALCYINYLIHVCADVMLDQGNTFKETDESVLICELCSRVSSL